MAINEASRRSYISSDNSTDSLLTAASSFIGVFEDILDYSSITIMINSDQNSGEPGLVVDWSNDGINIDGRDLESVPANGVEYTYRRRARYFRVTFNNGSTNQTRFDLKTIVNASNIDVDDNFSSSSSSSSLGLDDSSPNILNIESPIDSISLEFNNFLVSQVLDITTANSGAISQNNSLINLQTGTNSNGSVLAKTKNLLIHNPGHESRATFCASFSNGVLNSYQRIGLFDSNDGFWIGKSGTTFGVAYRKNGVDTFIPASTFSEDKLDGNSISNYKRQGVAEALDTSNLNIFQIRFGKLGSSTVYFDVITPEGNFLNFHKLRFPNSDNTPFIENSHLPISVHVEKSSADTTNIVMESSSWRGATFSNSIKTIEAIKNSSTTTLTANSTFTGSTDYVLGFNNIAVSVYSDVASATDGLILEFSKDGSNFDWNDTFTIPAGTGKTFTVGVIARFFRVRYINGATNQSQFRLSTVYLAAAIKPSTHRIADTVSTQDDAELVKAQVIGIKENGDTGNVALSNTNSLKVALTDRYSEVRNRTKIESQIFRTSLTGSNTTIYTVTPGKTLYITSYIASYINNANAIGEWRIRDNNTDKFGFVCGEKTLGASAVTSTSALNLAEPIPFTTSVTAREISGDIQLSFYFIGYEE